MKEPIIIGIAGGSASGKTSISKRLFHEYRDHNTVVVIRQDDYYRCQDHLTMEERLKTNYDHPFAFDNEYLVSQIQDLMNGKSIKKPLYDFVNHTRSEETEEIRPADVIIIEGLFVLENKDLRNLLDIKVFVDAPADVRFIRRLMRDVNERGRSLDNVVDQYMSTVRTMHEMFVEPSKRYADVIIPEGGKNVVAIDLLTTKISSIIN